MTVTKNFCDYIRNKNIAYSDDRRSKLFYDIQMMKDSLKGLMKMEQTPYIHDRIKQIKSQIKFNEINITRMGAISPEELLETLEKDKRVGSIVIGDTKIGIVTKNLKYLGKNIGKYIIEINMRNSSESVYIRRVDGRTPIHTFINNSGYPCYGDRNYDVSLALREGGFFSVAQLSMELLSTSKREYHGGYIQPHSFLKSLEYN